MLRAEFIQLNSTCQIREFSGFSVNIIFFTWCKLPLGQEYANFYDRVLLQNFILCALVLLCDLLDSYSAFFVFQVWTPLHISDTICKIL